MPGPVRKEKQFRLPDDFSKIDVIIFEFSLPFGDVQNCLHDEREARNFNIYALRGRNRRSLVAVM